MEVTSTAFVKITEKEAKELATKVFTELLLDLKESINPSTIIEKIKNSLIDYEFEQEVEVDIEPPECDEP